MESTILLWPVLGGLVGLIHAASVVRSVYQLRPANRKYSIRRAMVGYAGRFMLVGLTLAVAARLGGGRGAMGAFAGLWITRWIVVGLWLRMWQRPSAA